jgi:uncharacterized protein (DUF2236 family)
VTLASLPESDEALLALAGIEKSHDPETGLFRADSWLRRVSGEPVLLFGGGRALLLEVAHPLVAAGVAQHSNFRADPFGRLQRTLDAMSAIAFGDRTTALAAARSVERAHARVHGQLAEAAGPFAAGTSYHGRDPELMRWVWATLVDTAWAVYERFVEPLSAASGEAYYADQKTLARVLGIPGDLLPPDAASFRVWFDSLLESSVLTVTTEARQIAEAVLQPVAGSPVRTITGGLLSPRLREAFGLEWGPRRAERLETLTASVRALRRPGPARSTAGGGAARVRRPKVGGSA